jgi:nitrogen fixation protein FixH
VQGWVGLILMFLVANIVMIYLAIDSNPGLVVEDYYERGQDYENTVLSKIARNPGWLMRVDVPQAMAVDRPDAIRFFLVDKAGQPVTPDEVHLYAYRPSDADHDFSLPMTEEGKGRYLTEVRFPLIGTWDLLVSARQGEEEYNVSQRINVVRP